MTMTFWIPAGVFLMFMCLGLTVTQVLAPDRRIVRDRLRRHLRETGLPASALTMNHRERFSDLPVLDQWLRRNGPLRKFYFWFRQSGLPVSFGAFLLSISCLFLAGFTFVFLVSGENILLTTACSGVITGLPLFFVHMKREKRKKLFSAAFPDAVSRMSSSLRAGYSLQMALEAVVEDSRNLVSEEFKKVAEEMEVGQGFETALKKILHRMDTPELRLFIASVAIQRESGGNLAELLENLESTIRERFQLRRELNAATSQAKFSGIVLSLLPVFVGFFVFLIHRDYIMFLFNDPAGKIIFRICVTGQIIGILCIRKIVKIEM